MSTIMERVAVAAVAGALGVAAAGWVERAAGRIDQAYLERHGAAVEPDRGEVECLALLAYPAAEAGAPARRAAKAFLAQRTPSETVCALAWSPSRYDETLATWLRVDDGPAWRAAVEASRRELALRRGA